MSAFRASLRSAAAACLWAAVCAGTARGDEAPFVESAPLPHEILVLKTGDRLTGNSVGVSDGRLRWQLPTGGEMNVPLAAIDRVEHLPAADELVSVEDEPAPAADAGAVVVATAMSDPEVKPAIAAIPVPALGDPLPFGVAWYEAGRSTYAFAATQTGRWTKRFEIGGNYVRGNNETSSLYVAGDTERKYAQVFHTADFSGRYAKSAGKVTQDLWALNSTTDFNKDSDWILFLSQKHLLDELVDLSYRGTFAGGIGYRFINEGPKRLITRLGPSTTVERFSSPARFRMTPDLFAETEFRWPLFDRTRVEYKGTFTPGLSAPHALRYTNLVSVLVTLDKGEAWAMKLGLRHDHNGQPVPGKLADDFITTFSLVYSRTKAK